MLLLQYTKALTFMLNSPWLASALIYVGVFCFGGICFIPVTIALYRLCSKKILPHVIQARRRDRREIIKNNEEMKQIRKAMHKQFGIVKMLTYELEDIQRKFK